MLWKIVEVEIVLVVATERQIEDADYKLAPRFLM
jgi:tRNA threonylcarbamoyladenosine modification (KEOPS) complex Cgi121 subunit